MRFLALFCFMCALLVGLKNDRPTVGDGFTLLAYSGDFRFQEGYGANRWLWWRDGLGLVAEQQDQFSNKNSLVLVMVSYNSAGARDVIDFSQSRILAEARSKQDQSGYVLLAFSNRADLDNLAIRLHSGSSFGCGKMEVLDLNARALDEPDEYVPSLYHEAIALSSASSMLDQVNESNIQVSIQTLQDLGTRFHSTTTGQQTPEVVKTMFENAAATNQLPVTVSLVESGISPQKSVVAELTGTNPSLPRIVIGSHLDSIHGSSGQSQEDAPGADDNASGVSVITEVIRVLSATQARFARTIEFHAYGAEEIGLVGSGELARSYRQQGQRIVMMMQLDMTGYSQNSNDLTIHLVEDDTSEPMRLSAARLLDTYLGGNYAFGAIGSGGTSDHRSWNSQGFQTVFPFQHPQLYNPRLHTPEDTLANMNNIPLAGRFSKLVLASLVHHGGLVGVLAEYETALANANFDDDLAVAIVDGNTEQSSRWVIGTPVSIADVFMCALNAVGQCNSEKVSFSSGGQRGSRQFHVTDEDLSFQSGSLWRLYGYDESGSLSLLRNVQAVKK